MAEAPARIDATPDQSTWTKWNAELEAARKTRGYKAWVTRGEKIIKRYRDQRVDEAEFTDSENNAQSSRFNILWSNVQTLMPAVLAKRPKPVVERRYLDRDDAGRTASIILERALLYEIDHGTYFEALRRAVLDRLLPGRGIVWVRYEPTFQNVPAKVQADPQDEPEMDGGAADTEEGGDYGSAGGIDGTVHNALDMADGVLRKPDAGNRNGDGADPEQEEQEKIYECVPVDYLDWKDFLCSPARTWEEVWWIAKRVYLTDAEGKTRFGDKWKDIKLDWTPAQTKEAGTTTLGVDGSSKAKIWEIWNKRDRKVCWTTESENSSGEPLEEIDDPLKLECFWPVPKPLSSTLTNDSLIPVPDYVEYQDQADELDELTGRITALTKALKIAGVYDGSVPELQRIFQEGKENELVAVANMAEFMQKAGGSGGMGHIWLLPIKEIAEVLSHLYEAREGVKQSLYEITGISDIVRGQSQGGTKTATEQRIKGQFASLRLNDIQMDVARFASDTLAIMGEIIAEHYSEETLYLVSAYEQYAREQFMDVGGPGQAPQGQAVPPMGGPMPPGPPQQQAMPAGPAPPVGNGAGGSAILPGAAPQPMNGAGPPAVPPMGMPPGMPMMAPPPPTPAQMAAELFAKAIALLRNDKLRGFRIEVAADSMIEPDQQAMQQSRVEFLTAVGAFLEKAVPLGQMAPKFMPILGKLLLFMVRSFKAGRELEGAVEQMVDDLDKVAKNPPPKQPTPEEIKAQAEIQKQKMEGERQQQQAALDQQRGQMDMAAAQQKQQMEIEKGRMELEFERQKLELEKQKLGMQMQGDQAKLQVQAQGHALDADAQTQQAAIDDQARQSEAAAAEHAAELDAEAVDHKHEVGLEMMDHKAKAAKAAANKGASK